MFGVLRVAMRRLLLVAVTFVVVGCTGAPSSPTSQAPRSPAELQARLADIGKHVDGTFAATVVHLPSGARASVNGGRRIPMMSVFKLPLVIAMLSRIEVGAAKMDERVTISSREIRSQISPVAEAWKRGDRDPTLETLLRMALVESDNTAGDKLFSLNGGKMTLSRTLTGLGISGVDIAEEEIDITARILCAGTPRPADGWTEATLGTCPQPTDADRAAAAKHESEAPPNGSTTDALAEMLIAIDGGKVLTPGHRDWLLTTMKRTNTGLKRLRAGLPMGTQLAHRSGTGETIEGRTVATNDIGIAWLPDGSRLVIAVAIANARGDDAVRDAAIADAARAAWDTFSR